MSHMPSVDLSAAIVATTLDPMDYLTNGRGTSRPNAQWAANMCYSQRTIGMHPAHRASVCASLAANTLHEAQQASTVGFFQPPYAM
jgi:hypothetical protein